MNATQWAEFAGFGFALAVMAWVIYRLTWTVVKLVRPNTPEQPPLTGEAVQPPPEAGEVPEKRGL